MCELTIVYYNSPGKQLEQLQMLAQAEGLIVDLKVLKLESRHATGST